MSNGNPTTLELSSSSNYHGIGMFGGGEILVDDTGGISILGGVKTGEFSYEPKIMYVSGGAASLFSRSDGFLPGVVGEGGVVYGSDGDGFLVARSISGSLLFSTNHIATGVLAEAGGGVSAVSSSGSLMRFAPDGALLDSAPLSVADPIPSQYGSWLGTQPGLVASVTSVQASPGFTFQRGSGSPSGIFRNRESAAVAALNFLASVTDYSNWEWGGLICAKSNGFTWSRLITSSLVDQVQIPTDSCSVNHSYAARFHTHPRPTGLPHFSGPDLGYPDATPGIPAYLLAPQGSSRVFSFLKTWNTGDRSAQQNICILESYWVSYEGVAGTAGARCDTPLP